MQPHWDMYESAILLDAYNRVQSGEITKKQAINDVSIRLRQRAINRGFEIDEKFRNIAGITFMMTRMQYSMTDGKKGIRNVSKIFQDVVALYREDPEIFEELVQEAQNQVNS